MKFFMAFRSDSPSKLEGVPERRGRVSESGVCAKRDTLHSQQADSSPNLGKQLIRRQHGNLRKSGK